MKDRAESDPSPSNGNVIGGANIGEYWDLTKPRLTFLVLITALVGFFMGSRGPIDPLLCLHAILGVALIAGGASAFNQIIEREADSRMKRTQDRPLPSGRLQFREALIFAILVSLGGALYLAWATNGITCILGILAWSSYVVVYTPMKRWTPLCTIVGAVPGALPPMMGWTAVTGSIDPGAWALFAILCVWQIPHFLALAQMYRDEYAAAGFPMLTVVDRDGSRTARQILFFCIAMVPVSVTPWMLRLAGPTYLVAALILGFAFLFLGIRAAFLKNTAASKHLFLASIAYLPALLILMVTAKTP